MFHCPGKLAGAARHGSRRLAGLIVSSHGARSAWFLPPWAAAVLIRKMDFRARKKNRRVLCFGNKFPEEKKPALPQCQWWYWYLQVHFFFSLQEMQRDFVLTLNRETRGTFLSSKQGGCFDGNTTCRVVT